MSTPHAAIPPVAHVIAGIAPRHGGPSYSVPRFVAALRGAGVEARLMTVRDGQPPGFPFVDAFDASWSRIPVLRKLKASRELRRALARAAMEETIFHAHGLWQMPTIYAARMASRSGAPLIVAPRGMLAADALEFSAIRKRLFWQFLQRPAFVGAACWHATSQAEAEEIRAFGIRAPIVVVPNGIDLPDSAISAPVETAGRTILYLGRLHPKKGLPGLLRAWAALAHDRPDWSLHVVGPDEAGHRGQLSKLAAELDLPRFRISDAVYGTAKTDVLHGADLFVLPTLNENFGVAVAEALAAGLPAIVTKGAPWSGLRAERCGWWIDQGQEALVGALRIATALPRGELRSMGGRGRAWMARDFGWEVIAKEMIGVYRWLSRGDRPPTTVLAD